MAKFDNPDRPPPHDDRTKALFYNFDRSRREYMDRQRDKFKALYKAYRSYSEVQDEGSVSNLSIPLISAHVDSFYARLVGMRAVVEVLPREPGDVTRAAAQNALIDYQWGLMNMLLKGAELAHTGLIYGIAWGKCTWKKEVRNRLVRQSMSIPQELEGIDLGPYQGLAQDFFSSLNSFSMQDVTTWDNPWYENIPPDQVYPSPDGNSIDACRVVTHRTKMHLDDLEALAKGDSMKLNRAAIGRLKKALDGGSLQDDNIETSLMTEAADVFGGTDDSGVSIDDYDRTFWLLEQWRDSDVRWAVSGNPDIGLLRDEPHAIGMKPLIRFTPDPLPNELCGTSLTEKLFSIWLEMNALKNAHMDSLYRTVHPQIMIPRGSMTDPSHIRFKAGGWFLADPQNPPQIFEYPSVKAGAYRELQYLDQQAQQIGGTNTFRGLSEAGDTTATEANLLAQASGTKFGAMLQQMNEQPFKRLGKLLVRLNELNVGEERYARVLGQEFMELAKGRSQAQVPGQPQQAPDPNEGFLTISPQDLASTSGAELDVTIDIASKDPDTKIVNRRRTTEAVQALGQISQIDPALTVLVREMAVKMAESHDIQNARKKVEQGEAAMKQQQQQMMQAQQAQEGQGQGGPGSFPGLSGTVTPGDQLAGDGGNASGLPS